jgi:hypothetical protein
LERVPLITSGSLERDLPVVAIFAVLNETHNIAADGVLDEIAEYAESGSECGVADADA